MKLVVCTKCGSNELHEEQRYVVCAYCRMRFVPSADDVPPVSSVIAVFDDVQRLLLRCRDEPENRRRIAGLILDIDPTNTEAPTYLR